MAVAANTYPELGDGDNCRASSVGQKLLNLDPVSVVAVMAAADQFDSDLANDPALPGSIRVDLALAIRAFLRGMIARVSPSPPSEVLRA